MKKLLPHLLFIFFSSGIFLTSFAQKNYFIDGYHGGIYGHYPLWVTKFIADSLNEHKDWKVNLEIEPETWDTIQVKDPVGYAAIKKIIDDSSADVAIEYVNPSYGQGYLYNISEESIIRQFQYGIKKLREHFPSIAFTTYSSEEPCFTSALPQILKSLGFKYASLKNPNTCWGGYVKAKGGEAVNWIGPDGTSILTVPRYASEDLQKKSTWQTTAWNNSAAYVRAAIQQGISNPVGMCLQDAGWKNGPWLGRHKPSSTLYTTWRNYFELIAGNNSFKNWRVSQEDINVSLVWGSQILQRIAQQVRAAENNIVIAEKSAALAKLFAATSYPEKKFDDAWRTLLLSQHHDCWIVPYNKHAGKTWAGYVEAWTKHTDSISNNIISQSCKALSDAGAQNPVNVFALNTTAINRKEVIEFPLTENTSSATAVTYKGKMLPSQIVVNKDSSKTLLFEASVPALGYETFSLTNGAGQTQKKGAFISTGKDGNFIMETNLYRLVIDAQHGGSIKELIAKDLNNKNFVPDNVTAFNTLRGNFYNDGGFSTNSNTSTKVTVLENGPLEIKLAISGAIGGNTFIQTIRLRQGEKRINCALHIDYKQDIGVGEEYRQAGGYYSADRHKAFYNDTAKLLAVFPLSLQNQKVYKDAPLDVTESSLNNTFYNSWDSIKNNIVDNWVDVTDGDGKYGMALLSDHVTSYSHGENFPLALTIQYAGVGLWGRNYAIDRPTDIQYALLPHEGKWNDANVNGEVTKWNQPIITSGAGPENIANTFIEKPAKGIAISTMYYRGNDLYVRLVNNSSQSPKHHLTFNCYADTIQFVELNDSITSTIAPGKNQKVSFDCNIPLFGFKTVRLVNAKSSKSLQGAP